MRKYSVYFAVFLGILLLPALSMAQRVEDAAEDEAADIDVLPMDEDEADQASEIDILAITGSRQCQLGAPGDACIFDLRATGSGTLQVCTKATRSGQRWRATIVQVLATGAVSAVGTGSTTAWTGCVSRNIVSGVNYEVLVTYERPLPGTFPTSVDVRFTGTGSATVSGPRLRSGAPEEIQSCQQVNESTIAAAAVDDEPIQCGTLMTCTIGSLSADTDRFTFTAAAGGAASLTTAPLSGSPVEPFWVLFDPDGMQLGGHGSPGSPGTRSLPKTGTYTIEVYDFSTNEVGGYALSLQGVSHAFRCGTSIAYGGPSLRRGRIDKRGDTDTFNFAGTAGQTVSVTTAPVSGSPVEPFWVLFDPDGMQLGGHGSPGSPGTRSLPKTGTYTIEVYDFSTNEVGEYSLSLQLVGQ
jgi:hypothetical protein